MKTASRHSFFALLLLFGILLVSVICCDEARAQTVWKESSSKVTCIVDGSPQKSGIKSIDGKKYYFDAKGIQRTGWRKVGGSYYFFTIGSKGAGSMVTNKVVNGVKLGPEGKAVLNASSKAELKVLIAANNLMDSITKPTQKPSVKLKAAWNYLMKKCHQRSYRSFHAKAGWQRAYAMDIFTKKKGDCESFACAFAYMANAAGFKNVKAIDSGGHSWAEVNGRVYDPEWAQSTGKHLYGLSYNTTGSGIPRYKANRRYVVTIAPQSKALGAKASSKTSAKTFSKKGFVKLTDGYYYFKKGRAVASRWVTIKGARYYFQKNGKAATGAKKIGKKTYVFSSSGKLLKGKKTRVVTTVGGKYRVTKAGIAKPGWTASKARYYDKWGRMADRPVLIKGQWYGFSSSGELDQDLTRKLRSCAVEGKDAAPLLALLGKPVSRTYQDSCRFVTDEAGRLLTGKDGILRYGGFEVYTFKANENGIEYYYGVEAV